MSRAAASKIASYLTTGFFSDFGYASEPFDLGATNRVRVFVDFSNGADLGNVELALDAWSSVTGIDFRLTGTADNHHLRLTDWDSGAYSYSNHSDSGERLSAVVNVGRDWMNAYGTATVSYYTQTWIHEIGHALGLGHAGPYNGSASWGDQKFAMDSWQMSIMSYFPPFENPNVRADTGYLLTPMPADIIAIHRLYGAPDDFSSGADVYGFDGTAGGIYRAFGDMLDRGLLDQAVMLTIQDSGGRDMLNLSRTAQNQRIDLHQGAFSDVLGHVGTLGIAYGTRIEKARSGSGDDILDGNASRNALFGGPGDDKMAGFRASDKIWAGNGEDRLYGGSGDDVLRGGAGRDLLRGGTGDDRMVGGNGADQFVFRRGDFDGRPSHDTIADFAAGTDVLDLRGLGLDRLREGSGPLRDGLVRAAERDGDWHLRADLDRDNRAELHIVLTGADGFGADDLLL